MLNAITHGPAGSIRAGHVIRRGKGMPFRVTGVLEGAQDYLVRFRGFFLTESGEERGKEKQIQTPKLFNVGVLG